MEVFWSSLSQMGFLFLLIVIGYILIKCKLVPDNGSAVLSKLENNVFIPALVMGTFMQNFTMDTIDTSGNYLLCGLVGVLISMPFAILCSRLCSKDSYVQNIYTYGLSFSNFGFMGNAVVSALFPDVFMNYLIYVLPFWIFIYLWGVPYLLIPKSDGKKGILTKLKPLVNPMFIGMIIGIIIGLSGVKMPSFFTGAVSSLGNCMSPIAMLLTGMTIAKIDIRKTLSNVSVYVVSVIRLFIMPLIAIAFFIFVPLKEYGLMLCTVCCLAMPLGLNTIVVPSAYGRDTSVAAGMALVSHLLSCISIPVIFMLFETFVA